MRLYVARHAKALKRASWDGPDELRGLAKLGWAQAQGLVEMLRGAPVARIVSSPYLRCCQTVHDFAAARGLTVETDARLAEGARRSSMLELLSELAPWPALVCSHGDVIPTLIDQLCRDGLEIEQPLISERGSVWVLEGKRSYRRGRYLPPSVVERSGEPSSITQPSAARHFDPPVRVAVLDLGSTSFHLMVADAVSGGEIKRVSSERIMLRLGASLSRSSRIPDDVCERAIEAARRLREVAEEAGAECLFPVATSAVRDAKNGEELAERLGDALGVPVRVLSGREEARLSFAAYRWRLPMGTDTFIGADLGGGSLELMAGCGERMPFEATLALGAARLFGELVERDPMGPEAVQAIRARVRELVVPHVPEIRALGASGCIGSGGTLGALARLLTRGSGDTAWSGGQFLAIRDLDALCDEFVRSTHADRLRREGVDPHRADLLPTGAVVLTELARLLEIDGYTYCDWGLREGVVLEALGLAPAASSA